MIGFLKVGQKCLKNEDKVGQKFIQKGGQSRTEKFGKEDKVGQKSLKKRPKPGQSRKSCRATHTSPKMRICPGKSGRMVTLIKRKWKI